MKNKRGPQPIALIIGQLVAGGGSERQLYFFLANCDRSRFAPTLFVSGELGEWESLISDLGIPIVLLKGSRLAKLLQFRRAYIALGAKCFFSWSSYTNPFGLALIGLGARRIGSFRNAAFADLPSRFRWLWSRMSLAGVSTVVCNSRETLAELSRTTTKKTFVYAPNAVELASHEQISRWREEWRARLNLADDQLLVAGVGRIAPQKNYFRFIDVIAKTQLKALIIGGSNNGRDSDELMEKLRSYTQALGLQDHILLTGKLLDAREPMCAADIFLLTSDHEGMPNVVLEAMAAGIPCVSTDVYGVSDLIDHGVNGYVVAKNVASLAERVSQLACDPELRQAMGLKAREAVKRFRPEEIAPKLWSLCESRDAPDFVATCALTLDF